MKKYKSALLFKICLVIASCLFFATSCLDEDKVNTGQLDGGEVTLRVFGPSPIPRGAELRIIGTNLDQVEAVIIPGAGSITEITRISKNEIRVIVPQSAEQGFITLKTSSKDITSVTELTFEESIAISKISPLTAKAGDVIKIEGDYLNLIAEIIFADDVHVLAENFISQSREAIEVKVPVEAQTGKVIVSNGADLVPEDVEPGIPTWVYSEEELVVTLPTITSISPETIRAGNELTIKGKDFDLVATVQFGGDKVAESFKVNGDKTTITVIVPADAQDGSVVLVALSGVEVASPKPLTLVVPTISSIAPNPVKNGAVLTVTGKDLDLISQIMFGGDKEGTIASGGTATEIKINVPVDAVPGTVAFTTLAEKTVHSTLLNFVAPTITSIEPATIMAGESVTITGANLDLVKTVTFGGNTEGVILSQSETSIKAQSLASSSTGVISLTTSNGTKVVSTQTITINSDLPVITFMPASAKPGAMLAIEGTKLHLVESILFQDNVKATQYGIRSESRIEVYVPDNAQKGVVTLTMTTYDGNKVVSPEFTISGTDPVTDESYVFFDFDNKGSWWGSYGAVENDASLAMSGAYFRINAALTGGWIDFFWRNGKNDLKTDGVTVQDWVIKMDVNVLGVTTPPFKFRLKGTDGDFWAIFGGLENRGGWYTVTIPLTSFVDQDGYGSTQLPNVQNIDSDFGLALAGEGMTNICIDNIRFEKK